MNIIDLEIAIKCMPKTIEDAKNCKRKGCPHPSVEYIEGVLHGLKRAYRYVTGKEYVGLK